MTMLFQLSRKPMRLIPMTWIHFYVQEFPVPMNQNKKRQFSICIATSSIILSTILFLRSRMLSQILMKLEKLTDWHFNKIQEMPISVQPWECCVLSKEILQKQWYISKMVLERTQQITPFGTNMELLSPTTSMLKKLLKSTNKLQI